MKETPFSVLIRLHGTILLGIKNPVSSEDTGFETPRICRTLKPYQPSFKNLAPVDSTIPG